MNKHTPTPYYYEEEYGTIHGSDSFEICGINTRMSSAKGMDFCYAEQAANAEFIVRACNSHDELVEALKDAISLLEDRFDGMGITQKEMFTDMKKAITKARGQV